MWKPDVPVSGNVSLRFWNSILFLEFRTERENKKMGRDTEFVKQNRKPKSDENRNPTSTRFQKPSIISHQKLFDSLLLSCYRIKNTRTRGKKVTLKL